MSMFKTLVHLGADINKPDAHGDTALSIAITRRDTKMIQELLNLGAKPTQKELDLAKGQALAEIMSYARRLKFDKIDILNLLYPSHASLSAASAVDLSHCGRGRKPNAVKASG